MKVNIKKIDITIEGITPLIMHNDTLCNPLHPITKKMKEISGVRKKTDEHHLAMARIEWGSSFYEDKELGIYMPTKSIFATIKSAAKKSKQGKVIVNAINFSHAIGFPLNGLKGQTSDKLWKKINAEGLQPYVFCESVTVGRAKIMRTRPIFHKWSVDFDVMLDTEVLTIEDFKSFCEIAGSQCGLCEHRPEKGNGSYGRFELTKFEVKDGR